jgi:flagellar motor switch protein FliN/FliY
MSTGADEGKTHSADRTALASSAMAHWSEALVSVIESMTGNRPKAESRVSPSNKLEEGFAWWGQSLSIVEQPCFWIGAPAESWTQLGRLILSALGVDEASDADIEATCRDLMAQTSVTVANQLASQFGESVTSGDSVPASQPNGAGALVFTWSLDAGLMSIEGTAVWAEEFLRRCSSFMSQPAAAPTAPETSPETPAGEALQLGGRTVDSMPRLDLRAKFILGRTTLPLREVFKLNVGSVIELDRLVTEPADVMIHGRLLARGQVVIVNGNYGLKIVPHQ